MTLIELQEILGERINIAINKEMSFEDRKQETELSMTIPFPRTLDAERQRLIDSAMRYGLADERTIRQSQVVDALVNVVQRRRREMDRLTEEEITSLYHDAGLSEEVGQ
jgi:hypothetical protein